MISFFSDMFRDNPCPTVPDKNIVYFAYRKGEAIECRTQAEAQFFSSNYEMVVTNEAEITEAIIASNAHYENLKQKFLADTREEFAARYPHCFYGKPSANVEIFNELYRKASDESELGVEDFDEIVERIEDLAELINHINRMGL